MSSFPDDLKRDLAERTRLARGDPRTTAQVISAALSAPEEARWELVVLLHFRATRDVLDAARSLCTSACPEERTLGANVLGQLGVPDRAFPDECVTALLDLLQGEEEAAVLSSACIALGHLSDSRCVEAVVGLRSHPDSEVRYAVVFALQGLEDELAISTLIELTEDCDESVRDWATFALGSQIDQDTPAIREALLKRLHDSDDTTAGEALVGLARRKDNRILDTLIERLRPERLRTLDGSDLFEVRSAELLADPRLLPVLNRVHEEMGDCIDVAEAICCCQAGGEPA